MKLSYFATTDPLHKDFAIQMKLLAARAVQLLDEKNGDDWAYERMNALRATDNAPFDPVDWANHMSKMMDVVDAMYSSIYSLPVLGKDFMDDFKYVMRHVVNSPASRELNPGLDSVLAGDFIIPLLTLALVPAYESR
eukprot:183601-Pleurochrysis_carterae.AAC.1